MPLSLAKVACAFFSRRRARVKGLSTCMTSYSIDCHKTTIGCLVSAAEVYLHLERH